MAIIILPVCFIAVFINAGIILGPATGKKEVLLCSILIFSTFLLFITEFLSAFKALNFNFVLISWGTITAINLIYLYTKRAAAVTFAAALKQRLYTANNKLSRFDKLMLWSVAVILLLVFAQGILYPPNNWDSMTYHLSRIVSWISQGSVAHFPTNIFYQIYQPPFAEYAIMHVNLLSQGDYFAASVQFCFFAGALVALAAIVKAIGLPGKYQVLAIVFCATIPEAVLQASSTQNDMVAGFFILAVYYFALKAIKGGEFKNFLFLGMATGLAFLTKAICYIYLAPAIIVIAIFILTKFVKTKEYNYLWLAMMAFLITLGVNSVQYCRNYTLSKNILGTPANEIANYTNKQVGPLPLLSNMVKNAGLQVGIMGTDKPAEYANKVIYKLHASCRDKY